MAAKLIIAKSRSNAKVKRSKTLVPIEQGLATSNTHIKYRKSQLPSIKKLYPRLKFLQTNKQMDKTLPTPNSNYEGININFPSFYILKC